MNIPPNGTVAPFLERNFILKEGAIVPDEAGRMLKTREALLLAATEPLRVCCLASLISKGTQPVDDYASILQKLGLDKNSRP